MTKTSTSKTAGLNSAQVEEHVRTLASEAEGMTLNDGAIVMQVLYNQSLADDYMRMKAGTQADAFDTWTYDDGGRAAAGYKGTTGDCATRSIAIISGLSYQTVYDEINRLAQDERPRGNRKRSNARTGVHKELLRRWLPEIGYEWTPTMQVGQGTTVHLKAEELPPGRLVVVCSKHYTAVIDGMIHDTYDPSRGGTRAVYGYYEKRT